MVGSLGSSLSVWTFGSVSRKVGSCTNRKLMFTGMNRHLGMDDFHGPKTAEELRFLRRDVPDHDDHDDQMKNAEGPCFLTQ